MKYIKNIWIIIGIVFLLDIFSKSLILKQTPFDLILFGDYKKLYPSHFFISKFTNFFNLILVWNSGVSFSMFANNSLLNRIILIVVAILITCYVIKLCLNEQNNLSKIAYSFIIGGAVGNIFDRIRYGAVIDFLDFHIKEYHWPAFNVADSFICLGVGILLLETFKNKKSNL